MRRLISILAVGVFLSVAGFATADTTPTTTATTTTTTTTIPTTTTTTTTSVNSSTTTTTPQPNAAPDPAHKLGPQHWFAGSVSNVESDSLSIGVLWAGPNDGSLNGQTVSVSVLDRTRINQGPHRGPIALADIQNGDLVAVRAAGSDPSSLTALKIHVFCNCHWIGGTISDVGSNSFSLSVKRTGPYDTVLNNATVTIGVDDHTVYLRGRHGARIGFSDLKAGEGVGVVFSASGFFKAPGFDPTTATFTAKRAHVWGARQVPPLSSDSSAAAGVSVS